MTDQKACENVVLKSSMNQTDTHILQAVAVQQQHRYIFIKPDVGFD